MKNAKKTKAAKPVPPKSVVVRFQIYNVRGDHEIATYIERVTSDTAVPSFYDLTDGDVYDSDVSYLDGVQFTDGEDVIERLLSCRRDYSFESSKNAAMQVDEMITKCTRELYDCLRDVSSGKIRAKTFHFKFPISNAYIEASISGSGDFYDISDESKIEIGEKTYRRWYDACRRLGLADFEYSFPVTNRDLFKDKSASEMLDAWREAGSPDMEDWLDSVVG